MSRKKYGILIILFVLISSTLILFAYHDNREQMLDMTAVNDIAESLAERWDRLEDKGLPGLNYHLDYVVLDSSSHYIAATKNGLRTNLHDAIRNRDTIIDIKSGGTVLGKLIIYNNTSFIWNQYKNKLLFFSFLIVSLVAVFCLVYLALIDKVVFRPFRKLQAFARHVAEGNLDVPLEMDKENLFGAFTESFDLMREELYKAREKERLAEQSKKELVASLSHDIKTPVASIKAVSEVMHIKSENESEKRQLEIIGSKADQINTLITNLFNAALEELQELKVTVSEQSSQILYELIKEADYNSRVTFSYSSECIVRMDALRLAQVIDNIISNSYKYAGTSIDVCVTIIGNFLEVTFQDYGLGVPKDELPLIFNKFYRAKNADGKSGTGLGLYISKYLMNKMSGDIECENTDDGFITRLKLKIA